MEKKLKVYSHPKCSTCKKAIQFLTEEKIPFTVVDITTTPPSETELRKALGFYGDEVRKLFNTSGMQYKELNLKDKLPAMPVEKAISLLSKNGMLVKRPFLLSKDTALLGFKEDAWRTELT